MPIQSIKKRIILFVLLFMLPIALIGVFQKKYIVINGQTMGTSYTIKCYVSAWINKSKIQKHVFLELNRLTKIFSTWDNTSEISLINEDKSVNPFTISNDLNVVLSYAYRLHDMSSGSFDPTVKPLLDLWGFSSKKNFFYKPKQSEIDDIKQFVGLDKLLYENAVITKTVPRVSLELSSIAKGYAVDRIALVLDEFKSSRYMIDIGGELKMKSSDTTKPWVIAVRQPTARLDKQDHLAELSIQSGALATSGDYENYFVNGDTSFSHIFNLQTMRPIKSNVVSVTVYAESTMVADGLATTLMVVGVNKGISIIETLPNTECLMVIREDGVLRSYFSSNFSSILRKIDENLVN